jgi:hypothetical protein
VKFLFIIFCFYILLLPGFPCMDKDECADKAKTEAASTASNHAGHEEEEEGCPPFCNCVCCGHIFTPGFSQEKHTQVAPVTTIKQSFFYKNIALSADFFGNIWQPPKWS